METHGPATAPPPSLRVDTELRMQMVYGLLLAKAETLLQHLPMEALGPDEPIH
jgi:hypothetical protein